MTTQNISSCKYKHLNCSSKFAWHYRTAFIWRF